MTLVHFHLTDAEGSGLSGGVSLVPTRRVTVRDAIRLPVAQTVKLTAGEATVEVMPSTTQWVWRASELVAAGANPLRGGARFRPDGRVRRAGGRGSRHARPELGDRGRQPRLTLPPRLLACRRRWKRMAQSHGDGHGRRRGGGINQNANQG